MRVVRALVPSAPAWASSLRTHPRPPPQRDDGEHRAHDEHNDPAHVRSLGDALPPGVGPRGQHVAPLRRLRVARNTTSSELQGARTKLETAFRIRPGSRPARSSRTRTASSPFNGVRGEGSHRGGLRALSIDLTAPAASARRDVHHGDEGNDDDRSNGDDCDSGDGDDHRPVSFHLSCLRKRGASGMPLTFYVVAAVSLAAHAV